MLKKKQKTPNHHLSLQQSCSPFAVGTSKTTDDHNKYSNTLKAGSSTRITKSRPRDTKWAIKIARGTAATNLHYLSEAKYLGSTVKQTTVK